MKEKPLRYLGILIIICSLIGMLFIIRGNSAGYAVFNGESNSSEIYDNGQMQISKIENIVSYQGGRLDLNVNVKNIGKVSLNNCQLKLEGDMISWMYSKETLEIKKNENINFLFNINIPSGTDIKDYKGVLEIKCNESSFSQNINIKVLKGGKLIKINELTANKNELNISYSLNRSDFIGENIGIDIWIINSNGTEIKRVKDIIKLNKEGVIEKNISIKILQDLKGNYLIYLALSDDLNNFIEQSFIINDKTITGNVVLGDTKNNIIGYIVFAIIIGIGLLFVFKWGANKEKDNKVKKIIKSLKSEDDYGDDGDMNNGLLDRKN